MSNSQEYEVHPEIKRHLTDESIASQEESSSASTPAETPTQSAGDQEEIYEQQEQVIEHPQELENQKSLNFKKLRQQAYKAERERDEYARRLKEIEESTKHPTPEQSYSSTDITAQRIAHLEQQIIQSRIVSQCPDFDSVVSPENIAALKREHPEVAASLGSSNDLYATALSTYKMIKTFGIHEASTDMAYNKQRILENSQKPRSTSSISPQRGESPLTKANEFAQGLTSDLKKTLYKQMRDAQKNG